jgi:hypothetical protein
LSQDDTVNLTVIRITRLSRVLYAGSIVTITGISGRSSMITTVVLDLLMLITILGGFHSG